MAEMKRAFYLQVYFDVWDDPLIAKMRATWKVQLINLLRRAVTSEEPGVILLPIAELARAGGMGLGNYDDMLDAFEAKRLIGFRKGDNAIIVARRLLPQLEGIDVVSDAQAGVATMPRQKTAEQLAAQAARQARSRRNRQAGRSGALETPDAPAPAVPSRSASSSPSSPSQEPDAPSEALQTFFGDAPAALALEAAVTRDESVTEQPVTTECEPNRIEDNNRTVNPAVTAGDVTGRDGKNAPSVVVVDFLIAKNQVWPDAAQKAAEWCDLDTAQVYAFWAETIRARKGGVQGALLADLLNARKPFPAEVETAYRHGQKQAARKEREEAKAREEARVRQEQADELDAQRANLAARLASMPPEERACFEQAALMRVRAKDRLVFSQLEKKRDSPAYARIWEEAQIAEMAEVSGHESGQRDRIGEEKEKT